MIRRLAAKAKSSRRQPTTTAYRSYSVLVLRFSHGTAHATPHHAAAVLHHGLMRRNHPALGKIGHLCGVILESFDGSRVGRGLDDDDSLLGRLIRGLDLVFVSEDRVQRRALDRETRVTPFFDPLSHFGDALLDRRRNLGIVRFRNRADAVWEVRHRAFDAFMVEEQVANVAMLRRGCGAPVHPHHSGAHTHHAGTHLTAHAAHLPMHSRAHLASHAYHA